MATLASMLVARTKATLYQLGLTVAAGLGVTTTSWAPGDPTRSLYHFVAAGLETLETIVAGFLGSAFLDTATADWLTLLAKQVFNVERVAATYAGTSVTLTNNGGGYYVIAAGDITLQDSSTGKTFRNTSGGTLESGPGTTLDLDFVADAPGADSSADAGAIDTFVTTYLGVTCSNTSAALGLDEEDDASLRDRCRAKLGTLSPNGPADAFSFVVRSSELTGESTITRARVVGDTGTGDVTIYVADADGPVAGGSVALAQTAVEQWAAPQCVTPTVVSVTGVTVPVTYQAWIYASVGEETSTIEAAIADALSALFASRPIGGDIIAPATSGKLYQSLIISTIKATYPAHTFRVVVSAPSGDTSLAISEVAVRGAVTGTITIEADP